MGKYTIKQLENLSGIKSHTIRIWEKRYNFFKPGRSDGNQRQYNDDELRHFLNIAYLYKRGYKPSKLSQFSENEINAIIDSDIAEHQTDQFDLLVIATQNFDEETFNKFIDHQIALQGVTNTFKNIIFPFLEYVGLLWQKNTITPANEHFASNLIKLKLSSLISQLQVPLTPKGKIILFLPENELHDIGLLLSYYILKEKGFQVLYLGPNLPLESLIDINEDYQANYLLTYVVSDMEGNHPKYLEKVCNTFPSTKLYVSGSELKRKEYKKLGNLIVLDRFEELDDLLMD